MAEISCYSQDSSSSQVKQRLLSGDSNSENKQFSRKKSVKQSVIDQMDFDQTLETVGSEHWYQKRAFLLFAGQWWVAAYILLCGSFLFPASPKFVCDNIEDQDQCKQYICTQVPKDKWNDHLEYSTGQDHFTASQEYHLICENDKYNQIIQIAPFVGSFLGFLVFPMIADNLGRKLGWILSWGTATFGCILMATSFNFWMILIGYFLSGFGANPAITLHYSFINEHSTGKLREYTGIGVQVSYGIGELFMVLQVYLIKDWRILCITMLAIPAIILNICPLFVQESPKFLYEKSTEKAMQCLNKIAKVNGKDEIRYNALKSMIKQKNDRKYSVVDLFRFKSLRFVTYCACFVFFSIQAIYYGISFSMGQIGGIGIYMNTMIISIAETLAYATTDLFIPKLKRKHTVIVGLVMGFLLSLSYIFIDQSDKDQQSKTIQIVQIGVAAVMRFNIAFVWTVVYIFFSELYPTTVRSLALGFTSLAGTFGSMGAPYLIKLCGDHFPAMVALGIISLVGAIHVIPLRETLNKPLLQQIKELDVGEQDQLLIEHQEEMFIEDTQIDDEEDQKQTK